MDLLGGIVDIWSTLNDLTVPTGVLYNRCDRICGQSVIWSISIDQPWTIYPICSVVGEIFHAIFRNNKMDNADGVLLQHDVVALEGHRRDGQLLQ